MISVREDRCLSAKRLTSVRGVWVTWSTLNSWSVQVHVNSVDLYVLCVYMPSNYYSTMIFPFFVSAWIFSGGESLLQVCPRRGNHRHRHAAQRRSRSSLCQEVHLRRQVSPFSLHDRCPVCCCLRFMAWHRILDVFSRFLVHRYSVLQQHAEENISADIDDPLETNHVQNGKIEFHDDSDEVERTFIFPLS